MGGWLDGWEVVKVVLRIAYSNQQICSKFAYVLYSKAVFPSQGSVKPWGYLTVEFNLEDIVFGSLNCIIALKLYDMTRYVFVGRGVLFTNLASLRVSPISCFLYGVPKSIKGRETLLYSHEWENVLSIL